jgi:ABC-2 type transport system ATP-binding protein
VTQAVLVEGRNRVRVHEPDGSPPAGFESVPPTLEDAYFVLMKAANGTAGVAP